MSSKEAIKTIEERVQLDERTAMYVKGLKDGMRLAVNYKMLALGIAIGATVAGSVVFMYMQNWAFWTFVLPNLLGGG